MNVGDRLSEHIRTADEETDLKFKKELKVHIFGPYTGLCSGVLIEMARQLRKEGFESAKVCSELTDPDRPPGTDNDEWNLIRSEDCLDKADVGIFVFFETSDTVTILPNDIPAELNSSVIEEIMYWIHARDKGRDETIVIFEGGARDDDLGSLISGKAKAEDIISRDIDTRDYVAMFEIMRGRCWDWVEFFSTD